MEIIKQTKYILILDEAEAKWLKAIMQNPIFDESPDEEPKDEKRMREKLFHNLEKKEIDNKYNDDDIPF